MSEQSTFSGQSFMNKEAALPPGRIVARSDDAIEAAKRAEQARGGTGSFLLDGIGWLTKKIPGTRGPIEKGVGAYTRATEGIDRKLGALAAGNKPKSRRYRIFSKDETMPVADHIGVRGKKTPLEATSRSPSLVAPVEKTTKFVAPFLATAYVADKLYPPEKGNLGGNVNQATYDTEMQKNSSLFDESLANQMDKVAAMQKIAELEEQVEKYAEDLEIALLEKKAAKEQLEKVSLEKESMEKRAAFAEQNLLEKKAEHEELRLRTIAQKRSKVAVDLTDGLLEAKLIKQANYQETVDRLMECDESTIKMYDSLVKEARTGSDCLETLSYFAQYKGNEKLAATMHDLAKNNLSRNGQTMGEAARDLKK